MPTYDYACAACGHRFEVVHGVHDHGPEACPDCGAGPVRKAFAPPTVLFKGSGWAKVDRRSSAAPAKRSSTEDSKASSATSDPAPAAAKGDGGAASTPNPSD